VAVSHGGILFVPLLPCVRLGPPRSARWDPKRRYPGGHSLSPVCEAGDHPDPMGPEATVSGGSSTSPSARVCGWDPAGRADGTRIDGVPGDSP